jgi:hypothetical protein
MSTVISDTSPIELLASVGGTVTYARVTSSRRLELTIADPAGGSWRLISWEATCSPSDVGGLKGTSIAEVRLDSGSGVLTIGLSDGKALSLNPNREVDDESIEDWELFTPDGLVLAYGPKDRCHLGKSNGIGEDASSGPRGPEMSPVRDSRQWKQACREIGLSDQERELASNDLHAWRLAMEEGR